MCVLETLSHKLSVQACGFDVRSRGGEARLGNGYKRLGDDCDRAEWEMVRTLWS